MNFAKAKLRLWKLIKSIVEISRIQKREEIKLKYAVVSYWVGETGDTEVWPYASREDARFALNKLWQQSLDLAMEDEDFDEENSYHEDDFAVVSWKDDLHRYFEVVKQNMVEEIR